MPSSDVLSAAADPLANWTTNELLTLPADQPIYQALTTLRRQHGQFAMVHDGDTPIGLITMHDLIDRLLPPGVTAPRATDRADSEGQLR